MPAGLQHDDGRLARSARYFPLVGVLVGIATAAVFALAHELVPPLVAGGLTLAAGLVLTGAMHEDGLADCCDGLGGTADRERALEIMRDSHVGTYGVVALIVSLGLRWVVLSGFSLSEGVVALVLAHTISRSMIPPVLVSAAYARTRGLASAVAGGVSSLEAAFVMAVAFGIAMIAGPVAGLAAFAAAVIAAGVMLSILIRRLGGYTGDGLGAIQQLAEIAVLVTLAGIWA